MSKRGAFRSVLSVVLAFLTALLMTCAAGAAVLDAKILNSKSVCGALRASEFSVKEHTRVREVFISYGLASNVSEDFFVQLFTDKLTSDVIADDMCASIDAIFSGNADGADFSATRTLLYDGLFAYAEEQGMDTENEDIVTGLNEFCDLLMEQYKNYVTIPYASTVMSITARLGRMLIPAALICIAASVALVILLFAFYRRKRRPMSYLAAAFGGTGLMLLAAPLLGYAGKYADKLTILDESLFSFFRILVNNSLISLMLSSVPFFAAFAVLAVLSLRHHRRPAASPKAVEAPSESN